jgi:hypothetical protein
MGWKKNSITNRTVKLTLFDHRDKVIKIPAGERPGEGYAWRGRAAT